MSSFFEIFTNASRMFHVIMASTNSRAWSGANFKTKMGTRIQMARETHFLSLKKVYAA